MAIPIMLDSLGRIADQHEDPELRADFVFSTALQANSRLADPHEARVEDGEVVLWGVANLLKLRQTSRAEDLLDALIGVATEPSQLSSGHRLLGQLYLTQGRLQSAETTFRAQLAVCANHPALQERAGCFSGANQLVEVLRRQRRPIDALALNQQILDGVGIRPTSSDVGTTLRQRAFLLFEAGDNEAALDTASTFLASDRDWGLNNGHRPTFQAFQARMLTRLGRHTDAIVVLEAAWTAVRQQPFRTGLQLCQPLADLLHREGRSGEAMDVLSQGLAFIDANSAAWGESAAPQIAETRRTMFVQLLEADRFERPELAEYALLNLHVSDRNGLVLSDLDVAQRRIETRLGRPIAR